MDEKQKNTPESLLNQQCNAPIEIAPEEFRKMGNRLVDRVADFLENLPERPVTCGKSPSEIRGILGDDPLPENGMDPTQLLDQAADLLFDYSTFNGHPRFLGYITSSAAPIGALADLLASTVNPNVGAFKTSPMATEIEAQTVRWIAEMIGYPTDCGGLLTSGGNVANYVGFLAARRAKAPWDVRKDGLPGGDQRMLVYASSETHTWLESAADIFGLGNAAVRWIALNKHFQMDPGVLREQIEADLADCELPFLVIGTTGTTGIGAVDDLPNIANICQEYDLWFHVDGAYGAFAAALPEASKAIKGLRYADSIALDPHKWLYSALEAGCILVRDPHALIDTFSYHPSYYHFEEDCEDAPINYYEQGPQNSRGFRALKVWLGLRQVGRVGYVQMIRENIQLAGTLYELVIAHPDLEAFTQNLSITTFRYVPPDLKGQEEAEPYLNELNTALLECSQSSGEVFLSNALLDGKFVLRTCIVNFRTTLADIKALPEIVVRYGREIDARMRK